MHTCGVRCLHAARLQEMEVGRREIEIRKKDHVRKEEAQKEA